jgi:hypothetical protein
MDPWCSGQTCGPVKAEIASSNLVGSAKLKSCFGRIFLFLHFSTFRGSTSVLCSAKFKIIIILIYRFCFFGEISMRKLLNSLILLVLILSFLLIAFQGSTQALPSVEYTNFAYLPLVMYQLPPSSKINIPDFGGDAIFGQHFSEMAIFWLGRISPSDNYADVRIGYNNSSLSLVISIFDRLLWYDSTPSPADLSRWDSVTLYLSQNASLENAYRFTAQINNNGDPNRAKWQLAERWVSTAWTAVPLNFTTTTGFRWQDYNTGGLNNNKNNRGWVANYTIPFSSLGLSNKPPQGTEWRMALILHDRDDANGTVILESSWPENVQPNQPNTWGSLHFGLAAYTPPSGTPGGTTTIRNKLNGATVPDAAVGGTTGNLCRGDPDYIWNKWANDNHGSDKDFNIQNQSDLADWPCFSKYYITFPLNSLPANKIILNATLTLYQWGNSGALSGSNQAQPSYIQVSTVNQGWNESTLTWNNAPLAFENITQAWVDPTPNCGDGGSLPWPCTPRTWDITGAVAQAYLSGKPINLVLYSSDEAYHSGKFFTTSDVADWDATGRPKLTIQWMDP